MSSWKSSGKEAFLGVRAPDPSQFDQSAKGSMEHTQLKQLNFEHKKRCVCVCVGAVEDWDWLVFQAEGKTCM